MDSVPEILLFLLAIIVNITCRRKTPAIAFLLFSFFLLFVEISLADQEKVPRALTAAQEAGLSDVEINRVLAYGYDVRVSTDNALELLEILTAARTQGFSVQPLFDKIDEGLAKRVSFEVLKAVLRKKLRDYQFILNLYPENINRDPSKIFPSLQRVADSIDLGLEYEELRLLFDGHVDTPADMFAVAALNMAFLKQLGFDSGLSLKTMRTGLTHKSLGPEWKDFFKIAALGKRKGISEEKISETAIKILSKNQSFKVFTQALGFGDNPIE